MAKWKLSWRSFWPPLPVWKRLDLSVFIISVYSLGVELFLQVLPERPPRWLGDFGLINAILLGVLLTFRNREAYERWWEARKLWGQLINESRNFAIKIATFVNLDAEQRVRWGQLIAGFAVALKYHLRHKQPLQMIPGFEGDPATPAHVPAYLAQRAYQQLHDWRTNKTISEIQFLSFDTHAKTLMDICGACERIQTSPVPLSYRSLLRHGTVLYILSAPWYMAAEFGFWAIPIVALMGYFLLGTEFTAEDVEEPFGQDGDDLALSKYCETIKRTVCQVLAVDLDPPKA